MKLYCYVSVLILTLRYTTAGVFRAIEKGQVRSRVRAIRRAHLHMRRKHSTVSVSSWGFCCTEVYALAGGVVRKPTRRREATYARPRKLHDLRIGMKPNCRMSR
ncbi:hypothetical protein GGR55DRAFT_626158, partial [Xylaria sp. FL0064]